MRSLKWPDSIGIGGRFASERVAGINRNTRPPSSGFHNLSGKYLMGVHFVFTCSYVQTFCILKPMPPGLMWTYKKLTIDNSAPIRYTFQQM
jgi:hypothetical protein